MKRMKRLFINSGLLVAVALTSACQSGPYAFFRDPGEQTEINRQYTAEVIRKQDADARAVGGTSGSGGGTLGSPR